MEAERTAARRDAAARRGGLAVGPFFGGSGGPQNGPGPMYVHGRNTAASLYYYGALAPTLGRGKTTRIFFYHLDQTVSQHGNLISEYSIVQ